MKNNFRTLTSGILTKISSLYVKKTDAVTSWNNLPDRPFGTEVNEDGVETIRTIDKKYIPDTLRDGVPVITNAEVGQTVIVKEVDKAGKPIAWEAGTSSPIPEPTTRDNGKFLRVVDGAPVWLAINSAEEATFGG